MSRISQVYSKWVSYKVPSYNLPKMWRRAPLERSSASCSYNSMRVAANTHLFYSALLSARQCMTPSYREVLAVLSLSFSPHQLVLSPRVFLALHLRLPLPASRVFPCPSLIELTLPQTAQVGAGAHNNCRGASSTYSKWSLGRAAAHWDALD